MRLEKIKLAGFKSFVDPTTVVFPHNLTGVVGPNGCGKSNVIDAVRWVMGESSAKTLRGESMADVIFNGSSSRKPVGQATIELMFDNSTGDAGGQYAKYAQISVRRQVSRDGQSQYYLNNVRCRRRDIMDLFLGTGLGPRSYAIIEQGMISRFVEARPEDLRVFLEEAAGVSKYKERRRETENRIRHTRENLARLDDLREEVSKQLNHLQRQARTAERYKALKAEERQCHAESLSLRLKSFEQLSHEASAVMSEKETAVQGQVAEQRRIEALIERLREEQGEASDAFNVVQARFYEIGGNIARLEQSIQHTQEVAEQRRRNLEKLEQSREQVEQHLSSDRERLQSLQDSLSQEEPELEQARQDELATAATLREAEQALGAWQSEWEEFNRKLAEPTQIAQVERARINHLEQHLQQLDTRTARLREEASRLSDPRLEEEIARIEQEVAQGETVLEQRRSSIGEIRERTAALREDERGFSGQLEKLRVEARSLESHKLRLQAQQEAALGKRDGSPAEWLQRQGLRDAVRLAEALDVEPGWELAVETVLGSHLEAVCTGEIEHVGAALPSLAAGQVDLFDPDEMLPANDAEGGLASLLSRVSFAAQGSPGTRQNSALRSVLGRVRTAADPEQAWAARRGLQTWESVVCRDGTWVGKNWARAVRRAQDDAGVLQREQALRDFASRLQAALQRVATVEEDRQQTRHALHDLEEQRERIQGEQNEASTLLTELKSRLSARSTRREQLARRRAQLEEEEQELLDQIEDEKGSVLESRERLHRALESMENLESYRGELSQQRDILRGRVEQTRDASGSAREHVHGLALTVERKRSARVSLQEALSRVTHQIEAYETQRGELVAALDAGDEPLKQQHQELELRLGDRLRVEQDLAGARDRVETLNKRLRQLEQERHNAEEKVLEDRSELEQLRLEQRETIIRRQAVEEQLAETGLSPEEAMRDLPEDATAEVWEERLQSLSNRIQRLGPVNLAAIDEFETQGERMRYLDAQHADVNESLATLERAIQKIDRETRTRFKETYDKVNKGFQTAFPRLFGGGHAFLELTGNDLLDTGILVMARPPGKRNSTIHLLSGGEKALTAVALVFAIFQLNPAPFCMLDEVDAPLDDANVGRFCNMVQEMSEKVQFIVITHNKVTMEMAHHLAGVTMQEPGVSRLVSVDVDEAVQLAAV